MERHRMGHTDTIASESHEITIIKILYYNIKASGV